MCVCMHAFVSCVHCACMLVCACMQGSWVQCEGKSISKRVESFTYLLSLRKEDVHLQNSNDVPVCSSISCQFCYAKKKQKRMRNEITRLHDTTKSLLHNSVPFDKMDENTRRLLTADKFRNLEFEEFEEESMKPI